MEKVGQYIYDLHDINTIMISGKKIVDVGDGWEIIRVRYEPWDMVDGVDIDKMVIVIEKK